MSYPKLEIIKIVNDALDSSYVVDWEHLKSLSNKIDNDDLIKAVESGKIRKVAYTIRYIRDHPLQKSGKIRKAKLARFKALEGQLRYAPIIHIRDPIYYRERPYKVNEFY